MSWLFRNCMASRMARLQEDRGSGRKLKQRGSRGQLFMALHIILRIFSFSLRRDVEEFVAQK